MNRLIMAVLALVVTSFTASLAGTTVARPISKAAYRGGEWLLVAGPSDPVTLVKPTINEAGGKSNCDKPFLTEGECMMLKERIGPSSPTAFPGMKTKDSAAPYMSRQMERPMKATGR